MILKNFSNLLDNFLLSRWIIRLRASNQIISLIAYLKACCQWTLANCFWYAWAKIICSRRISLIWFIFWINRSTCIHFECSITFFWVFFDFNFIRECCLKLARNDVHWVLSKKCFRRSDCWWQIQLMTVMQLSRSACYERAQSSIETHVLWASLDSIESSANFFFCTYSLCIS